MINIGICEDNVIFLKKSYDAIAKILFNTEINIMCFSAPLFFIEKCSDIMFDIVFLDIEMTKSNRFEIAKVLYKQNSNCIINVVTSYEPNTLIGYDFNVFRFLRKKDFSEIIESVVMESYDQCIKKSKLLILKYKGSIAYIKMNTIYYILSSNNYITVRTPTETLEFRTALKPIKKLLEECNIVEISRGVMVNPSKVKTILMNEKKIIFDNYEHLLVSKRAIKELRMLSLELG